MRKMQKINIYEFIKRRPISWSAVSSFDYDPEEWYKNYIQGGTRVENAAMTFGKIFAESCEARKPLAPVTLLSKVEYPLQVMMGRIPLVGYADTYEPHSQLGEFKTGKKPWTQKRVDEHGQIDMYLLMLFIMHEVKPEEIECYLQWIPTIEHGDFSVDFVKPIKVHTFKTKRTMVDILNFAAKIKDTVEKMQQYIDAREPKL